MSEVRGSEREKDGVNEEKRENEEVEKLGTCASCEKKKKRVTLIDREIESEKKIERE